MRPKYESVWESEAAPAYNHEPEVKAKKRYL
jgi:hypothetical protein